MRRTVTRAGERAAITLRDGSTITLAPGSELRVPRNFGTETRAVVLVGEAYFSVKNGNSPFIVQTGRIATRVLGTEFTVRRYAAQDTAVIAVVTGKVRTGGPDTGATVTGGEVARVTDSTVTTRSASDVSDYTAWTRNRLVFDDTEVAVMLRTMSRWYGYEFRLSDSTLNARKVSAEFDLSNSDDMLAVLRQLLHVTVTREGKVLTLRPTEVRKGPAAPRKGSTQFPQTTEKGR
jgi:ferric-dicitrate binding protein FerR (iron transport regulator)